MFTSRFVGRQDFFALGCGQTYSRSRMQPETSKIRRKGAKTYASLPMQTKPLRTCSDGIATVRRPVARSKASD